MSQFQKKLYHFLYLLFIRAAIAGDGKFHRKRLMFRNRHTTLRRREKHYTARLAHANGGIDILIKKKFFYGEVRWVPRVHQIIHCNKNLPKTLLVRQIFVGFYAAKHNGLFTSSIHFNDAVSQPSKSRVNAENARHTSFE